MYDCVENNKILIFGDLFRFTIEDEDDMGNFEVNVSRIIRAIDRISIQYEVKCWFVGMEFAFDGIHLFVFFTLGSMASEHDFHSRNNKNFLCAIAETCAETQICFIRCVSITIQR